jgi:hypothetical protein
MGLRAGPEHACGGLEHLAGPHQDLDRDPGVGRRIALRTPLTQSTAWPCLSGTKPRSNRRSRGRAWSQLLSGLAPSPICSDVGATRIRCAAGPSQPLASSRVQKVLGRLDGVRGTIPDHGAGEVRVLFDPEQTSP